MRRLVVTVAVAAMLAGCASTPPGFGDVPSHGGSHADSASPDSASPTQSPSPSAVPVGAAPLRVGERWVDLGLPGGSYTPEADAGGTDDYRCVLLDPGLSEDVFLAGTVLQPGNPELVHHAILYRVEPEQVSAAEERDASDPRLGWSCFGGPDLPDPGDQLSGLDAAPWVAAFATTGGEQRFRDGTGVRLAAGSQLVLQMHYNLLHGSGSDDTTMRLRVAPSDADLEPLQTMLLPAPVELPCTAEESGPLCDREAAVFDVIRRFGTDSGRTVAGLQVLCDGSLTEPKAGSTQTCLRRVSERIRVQAVAGHMHLLGRSIQVDLERADGRTTRLLDVPAFDFDDQRARRLAAPVTVRPGDQLRVTCTHDASLRSLLPELRDLPPRYVVWGEGSSDEMCLGIVSYTRQ